MDFLTELFQREKLAYSTVNGYRAAISSTHTYIEGQPIGAHPLITKLFKGFYHIRPPKPRYPVTWEVSRVLDYLKSLHPSSGLSLKQLTLKTVMLIALTSSDRGQAISKLDIKFCNITNEFILFVIPELTKTSSATKPHKTVKCPSFRDKALDVRHYVKQYIKRTEKYRDLAVQNGSKRPSKLFISFRKPYKQVTSQTIARWVKSVMSNAGINTSYFKAHSTRGAASSAAIHQGATLTQVLQLGDWSSNTTFTKFYCRHTDSSEVGRMILQTASQQ